MWIRLLNLIYTEIHIQEFSVLHLGFGNEGRQSPPSSVLGGRFCQRKGQFIMFILNLMQIIRFSRGGCCPFTRWEGAAQTKRGQIAPSPPLDATLNFYLFYYTPHFNEVERGVYLFHLVRLSVCGQNRVRSVSITIFVRSISYLHILSSNFRRCVACNVCLKVQKFEILVNS